MGTLDRSWGALTPQRAKEYLKSYGAPSAGSKQLLVEILSGMKRSGRLSILDLGCGNGHLYEFFRESGLECDYTGVDFSEPLIEAAKAAIGDDPHATLVRDDVNTLESVDRTFDVVLYSHVIEMLDCPEASLRAARKRAESIVIRFFEPPEAELDLVELREMEVGDGTTVPYLRRTMGRDYYRLILTRLGCTGVDIYQDETAKDQVHVLRF